MAKVTVVWKKDRGDIDPLCGPLRITFLGVFSDHQTAIRYCEYHDPKDERLFADEFEIDALVDDEFNRELPTDHPCWDGN